MPTLSLATQEYCDAGSLRQAILKFKFLDVKGVQPRLDFILATALELASGLAHLHSKNIIRELIGVPTVK